MQAHEIIVVQGQPSKQPHGDDWKMNLKTLTNKQRNRMLAKQHQQDGRVRGGVNRAQNLSKERTRKISSMGGDARAKSLTPEQRSEISRNAALKMHENKRAQAAVQKAKERCDIEVMKQAVNARQQADAQHVANMKRLTEQLTILRKQWTGEN